MKKRRRKTRIKIPITDKQIEYEFGHFLEKLKKRDSKKYKLIKNTDPIATHPVFRVVKGQIEDWEIVSK